MNGGDEFLLGVLAREHMACPVCGYDLHGLTVARCTECGKQLELRVFAAPKVRRAWLAALIGFAGVAGMGVIFAVGFLGRPASRSMLPNGGFWTGVFWASTAMIPVPVVMLMVRRVFTRLPLALQWAITAAALAACGVAFYGLAIGIH